MPGLLKNTASQKWRVYAFNATTGAPVTGDAANITAKIDKDWAGVAAVTDTNPTETEDGYYLFDLTQAETNANWLDLYPDSSTADVVVVGVPGSMGTIPTTGLLAPTTAGRTLDVTATGAAGVDWGNVENPTTTVGLSGTTIATSQVVASVSGAVGSVTGNVGGNVAGSVASVTAGVTVTTNNDKTGYSLSQSFPANFASLGINASGHISRVVLVDTLTTYTGNTPQTGDTYALANGGSGFVAIKGETASILADTNELQTDITNGGRTDLLIDAIKAKTDNLPASPASTTNITAASGIVLASNGLDSVSTTAPTGLASNFREMVVQTWRRWFKKATKTSTEIKTYADDGTTVVTTQPISDSAGTQTQGPAS
jgi:hypothetical protein